MKENSSAGGLPLHLPSKLARYFADAQALADHFAVLADEQEERRFLNAVPLGPGAFDAAALEDVHAGNVLAGQRLLSAHWRIVQAHAEKLHALIVKALAQRL